MKYFKDLSKLVTVILIMVMTDMISTLGNTKFLSLVSAVESFSAITANVQATTVNAIQGNCLRTSKFNMTDYLGLYTFYNATDGPNWRWMNFTVGIPWKFVPVTLPTNATYAPVNPCYENWQGLACNSECNQITLVSLIDYHLNGELSKIKGGLCDLTMLESLDLSFNRNLTGKLPSCFGHSLPNLQLLSLQACQMTGSIPPSYSGLRNLLSFTLSNNSFTGTLPAFFPGNLTQIQYLLFDGNFFEGEVWNDLNRMPNLIEIVLSNNFITGTLPHSLTEMRNLSILSISNAALDGSFPHGFHNVSSLTVININSNQMIGYIKETWLHSFNNMIEFNIGSNFYTGLIPSNISLWQDLQYLNLYHNLFSGPLPDSLGDIHTLKEINVKGNQLHGTIPHSIGYLKRLQTFNVASNFLNGSLPNSLGNCTNLNDFYVNNNELTGIIPISFANLTQLNNFDASTNLLKGHIPAFFGNMKKLLHLELDYNQFSGEIPVNVTTLPLLGTLYLDNNMLTGTFPKFFKNTSRYLTSLDFGQNMLHGTIQPDIFECLPSLIMFSVEYNMLSGSFPSLTYLDPSDDDDGNHDELLSTVLTEIYMNNNEFDGSLMEEVGLLVAIRNFDLHQNFFTGTIPTSLWTNCVRLNYLYLYSNTFYGTLSSSISNFNQLVELRLDLNAFSGSFPLTSTNQWQELSSVNMSYNDFSGSLPAGLQMLTTVQIIDLSNNAFDGVIGNKFANLLYLEQLFLQSNKLQGNLNNIVNATTQRVLNTVDVSDNEIHGILPQEIFSLPNITIFSASKNCITGGLPENICAATSLVILALDGLHAADACQDRIFPGSSLITAYILKNPLNSNVPSCLFNTMPNLQTLHLSGNGISGDISGLLGNISSTGEYGLAESLTDLSLSYNRLTGTIPDLLMSLPASGQPWSNLDLSFNKLTGTLLGDMWNFTGGSLRLDINRLSGGIPKSLRYTEDINILDGNLFICEQSRSSIPKNDPESDSYVCGSDAADRSIYTWIAFSTTALVLIFILTFIASTASVVKNDSSHQHSTEDENRGITVVTTIASPKLSFKEKVEFFISSAKSYWDLTIPTIVKEQISKKGASKTPLGLEIKEASEQIRIFGNTMLHIRVWSRRVAIFILCTSIPIAIVLSLYYSRYTFSYAWFISIAFLTGEPPALVLLAFFMIFLGLLYCRVFCTRCSLNLVFLERRFYALDLIDEKEETEKEDESEEQIEKGEEEQEDHWLGRMTGVQTLGSLLKRTAPLSMAERIEREEARKARSNVAGKGTGPVRPRPTSNRMNTNVSANEKIDEDDLKRLQKRHRDRRQKLYLVLFAIALFNVVVVLGVNMTYVFFLTTDLRTEQKQFLSFLLAVYKFLWNTAVMEFLQDFAIGFLFLTSSAALKSRSSTVLNKRDSNASALSDVTNTESIVENKEGVLSVQEQEEADEEAIQGIMITFFMLLSLFNNILAPVISVAIVSSDCFYYATIQNPPEVTSSYSVTTCNDKHFSLLSLGEVCTVQSTTVYSTSYNPPFVYSYQCTSELLVNFVDIYIYRYLLGGIVAPAIEILLKLGQEYLYQSYGEFDWRVVLCTSLLQPMLRPVSSILTMSKSDEDKESKNRTTTPSDRRSSSMARSSSSSTGSRDLVAVSMTSIFQKLEFSRNSSSTSHQHNSMSRNSERSNEVIDHPLSEVNLHNNQSTVKPNLFSAFQAARQQRQKKDIVGDHGGTIARPPIEQSVESGSLSFSDVGSTSPSMIEGEAEMVVQLGSLPTAEESKRFPLFKAKNYIIILVSDIAILLVFGTVFPPIAVIGCVSVVLRTIYIQIILGRFIYLTQQQAYLLPYLQQINKECLGIRSLLLRTFQTISDLLAVIWGYFLFDILGDKKGFIASAWIFVVMGTMGLTMRVVDYVVIDVQTRFHEWLYEDEEDGVEGEAGHKSWLRKLFFCCKRKPMQRSVEMTSNESNKKNQDDLTVVHNPLANAVRSILRPNDATVQ